MKPVITITIGAVMDAVITEVRRNKQEIAAAFDYDVMALGRSLQQRETGDSRFKTPSGEGAAGATVVRPDV